MFDYWICICVVGIRCWSLKHSDFLMRFGVGFVNMHRSGAEFKNNATTPNWFGVRVLNMPIYSNMFI